MKKNRPTNIDQSRRNFLAGMAAAGSAALLPGCGSSESSLDLSNVLPALPSPEKSGIDHIVVVMMENRSFDHFLGWAPGANGIQSGLSFPDKSGKMLNTFRLSQNPSYGFQGCGWADPDHDYKGGRVQFNNGNLNGWLTTASTVVPDQFPIGYYTAEDLPFYKAAVENYTILDRYFCGILSQTFPNRFYMHAGQTDRNDNALTFSTLPTIWDRLAAKGRSAKFYFSDVPFIGLWRDKYTSITQPFTAFQTAAAGGQLPDVCYIDPNFGATAGESPAGFSQDDHPQADVRNGQAFLAQVYETLRTSPQWDRTLLIINYDEWGGFYDHVAPPLAPVTPEEFAAIGNDGRLGFRVPCVLMGPRARKGYVEHLQFDHNSILNFICWRFGLDTLGARGQTSLNLAYALDLTGTARSDAPKFAVPTGPFNGPCAAVPGAPPGTASPLTSLPLLGVPTAASPAPARNASYDEHQAEWQALLEITRSLGFPSP
jgi:phospholipase C